MSDYLLFLHLLSFIATSQTSFNNLVVTALLSPFISWQLSGLPRDETRTGSYNRSFEAGVQRQCLCVFTNERPWLWATRGAHPRWWTASDRFPPPAVIWVTIMRDLQMIIQIKSNMIPVSLRLLGFWCKRFVLFVLILEMLKFWLLAAKTLNTKKSLNSFHIGGFFF